MVSHYNLTLISNITLKFEIILNDNSLRMVLCMCVCKDGVIVSISDMYYRERQVPWDTQTRGIGVSILGCMWVLGNPGIFRQGGGYRCLTPGINLGTRILRQGEDQYLGICLRCT